MGKLKPGLVSVTFRKLSVADIIALCAEAGLGAIEWGGDVHVPDVDTARKTADLMRVNGMETVSYGSYYRAGTGEDFTPALNAAVALNAPNIRIWAGDKNPDEADATYRAAVVADIRNACDMADKFNVSVSVEYHGNTLTNTQESAVLLLGQVSRTNFYSYWQPLGNTTREENIKNIGQLRALNKLSNIHAYYTAGGERKPFADGRALWADYFKAAEPHCGYALLEFVMDDDPRQFIRDASALINVLDQI